MTYNPNVPQGNQTIASTQSPIQTNFSILNSVFGQDHVSYTTSSSGTTSGRHNQVTLLQQSGNPSAIVNAPILFVKNSTKNELFIEPASGEGSVIQLTNIKKGVSVSQNGYSFLPGGILIQWGYAASPTDNVPISFPTAFPNNCFSVVITAQKTGAVSNLAWALKDNPAASLTSFTIRFAGTTLNGVSFIAIGN